MIPRPKPPTTGEFIQQAFDANRDAIMGRLAMSPRCNLPLRYSIHDGPPAGDVSTWGMQTLEFTFERRDEPTPSGQHPWRVTCAGYVVAEGVE